MKLFLLLIMNLFLFQGYAQIYKEEDLKNNKVKEITITASQFENGKLLKKVINKDFINKYGKSDYFIKYKENGEVDTKISTYYQNSGKKSIDTIKDENNKLKYVKIILTDSIYRIIKNFQINDKNDTLVYQIRYKNLKNQDSILVNRRNDKSQYLRGKWFYNKFGELTLIEIYDENGKVSFKNEYNFKQIDTNCKLYFDGNNQKDRKVCVQNGNETIFFFKQNKGFLYGVYHTMTVGGRKEIINNKNGLLESISYFDNDDVKLSEITFSYKIE